MHKQYQNSAWTVTFVSWTVKFVSSLPETHESKKKKRENAPQDSAKNPESKRSLYATVYLCILWGRLDSTESFVHVSHSPLFFPHAWTVTSYGFTVQETKITVHTLKNIKNGHTVLFTHLKIILLQYFQFSIFSFSNNKFNTNGLIWIISVCLVLT